MKVRVAIILFIGVQLHAQVEKSIYNKYDLSNFEDSPELNQTIDFDNINFHYLHAAVFFETNRIRVKRGLKELDYSPELEEAAQLHSEEMVKDDFFSHYNKKTKKYYSPQERVALTGIKNAYPAENIAEEFGLQYHSGDNVYVLEPGKFSYQSGGTPIPPHTYLSLAQAVVDSWMHSPPHKKNIISKDAIALGCGAAFDVNTKFNSMPYFKITQNFQLYEVIQK
jgi:uncharacterized protein YkwD